VNNGPAVQKNAPCLLIRADASSAIGSGHVMRCLALAKAWQRAGGNIAWVMAEGIAALEDRLLKEGIDLQKIDASVGSAQDAAALVSEARRRNAPWVVVDGYRFAPDYIRQLKASKLRVLHLDDDGRYDSYPADAVLNQNICATTAMYERRDSSTQLLLGPEYVLLRPEFLGQSAAREIPAIAKKLLVTMGGSDPDNVTGKVLRVLANSKKPLEVKVVIGGGNPHVEELAILAGRLPLDIQVERNPRDMAPLMNWADVAISAAGSTCWELAFMGVPAIVIPISSDQRGIAESLGERRIAANLGWHANLSEKTTIDALERLLEDRERRAAFIAFGRSLVDGRGAERVVNFLRACL